MNDFKKVKYIFLLGILCAYLKECSSHDSQPKKCKKKGLRNNPNSGDDGSSGYIFTCPRTLNLGSNNELNLKRYGSTEAGNLLVQVFYKKEYSSKNETLAARKKFKIPEGNNDLILNLPVDKIDVYPYDGRVEIKGAFGDQKINGSDSVRFATPKTSIVIIQTDKPMYQPGQTVKFRVVKVNKKLKPCKKNSIVDIFVLDPKKTRLFQFKNVDLSKGIVQKEFPISDEPVQGRWSINIEGQGFSQNAGFDVKEYVLPKFDVNIEFPPFVLANAKFIPITICANYTYGEPVIGTLNLNASLETYYYELSSSEGRDRYPTIEKTVQIDGCYKFKLNVSKIEIGDRYSYRRIKVFANVIEKGTGVQRNKTEYLERQTSPLNLEFIDSLDYFKPGLPYNGKLKISNPDNTPAKGQPIEICATIMKKRVLAQWWATKTLQVCKNYTSCKDGIIKFILMPQNTDAISVDLNAKSLKYKGDSDDSNGRSILSQPQTSKYLNAYYSPSGSFIQIQPVHEPIPCKSTPTLKLLYTAKKGSDYKFYYQVSRQSSLVLDDYVETSFSSGDDVSSKYENGDRLINGKLSQLDPPIDSDKINQRDDDCPEATDSQYLPPIGEVNLDLSVDSNLSPEIHVLVYYVRDDNEVVADSIKIKIENCLPNKVKFSFGDAVQQPGLETAVKIKAAPNSLCGIRVVDKSVTLLDDSDNLTKEKVYQMVAKLDTNNYYPRNPCYGNKIQPGLDNAAFKSIIRPFPIETSSYEDSLTAFQTSGYVVISNLFIVTRPCNNNVNSRRSFHGGPIGIQSSIARRKSVSFDSEISSGTQSVKAVRDYFPETWLFEMEMVGGDGTFITNKVLPDTITEWIGNAVCVGAEAGLGISNTTSITAFQAFFLDYTLPVSVIRGEEFVVIVSIFNYEDDALPVTITLDYPKGFKIIDDSVEGDICIQPKTSENLRLTLKATQLGKVNLTVRAETSQSDSVCGDSPVSDSYAKDAIRKPIEVEPEGFPTDYVINSLFCPSDEENNVFETKVTLTLPDDVVTDSERAFVDISGNVLGPAINNLESLVSLPTGCGEQNMVKFVPNLLVLDYLEEIGMLTEDIKRRAIMNLNSGYQRELTYRHDDGSFSAFGQSDNGGSMFLTAFVLRYFYEAQRYIAIDETILKQMQDFIVSKQQKDGCFPDVGRIIDIGLEGGIDTKSSPGAITAYVLASLSISKLDNATVTDAAVDCLKNNKPSNPYSKLLYAYAEALAGKTSEAKNLLDEARQRVNRTDGMESFIIVNGTESIEIEADAYAVLTTLAIGGSAQEALPYVRYLTTHLNPNGGFKSTQDTCVGLDALSKFATLVYKDPLNLEITITGALEKKVKINDENKLLVQRFKVSEVPGEINVKATGTGCGLIQTSVRYNTLNPPEKKKFSLEVNGKCANSNCNEANLNVLVSYLPEGLRSGMSVIQIKMITGFVPDTDSINGLKQDKSTTILRVDVEDNTVIIYFSEISNSVQEFSFKVIRVVEVTNPIPGIAKVFDYYANENTSSTSYKIEGANERGSDEN